MNSTLNFIDGHQISYAVAGACALFLFLLLLFELLRTRLYWIYEPRVHRDDYKSKTPPAPGRTPFAWVRCVFEHWSNYEQYAGVDGVVLAHILRYMTDQCLFAAVVGFVLLVPTYVTGDGLSGYGYGKPEGGSFSRWTITNIYCRSGKRGAGDHCSATHCSAANRKNRIFPHCKNGSSEWRFVLVVACAWLFTLRALVKLTANYRSFAQMRHRYLLAQVPRQHALSVILEDVPPRLRSSAALRRIFEKICGSGSVHSATVAVAGLGRLERLVADLDGEANPKDSDDGLAPVADELAAIAAAQPRDRLFWFGGDDDDSVARTWWGSCHSVEPAPAYEPTATAFVTFTRPAARALAIGSLLTARSFPMVAAPAPEPRDLIWKNVTARPGAATAWAVRTFILGLLVAWVVFSIAVASVPDLFDDIDGDRDQAIDGDSLAYRIVGSTLPSAVFLCGLNLLPVIFKFVARRVERVKAASWVDVSVVRRFFLFLLTEVYAVAITAAVVPNFRRAFRTPLSLAKRIAVGTPEAAFYFAKLAALSCGATPLRLLRPVSLLRRGWRIHSRPLKEKAAVKYGRTLPKVILAFATFSMFWVMVPAISLIALLYFFLVNVSTRYLVLYAHMPKFETGGAYYYVVVERILFSLGASNVILGVYFVAQNLYGYAILVAPLPCVVYQFHIFALAAFAAPTRACALDEAVDIDISPATFDEDYYLQPSLKKARELLSS